MVILVEDLITKQQAIDALRTCYDTKTVTMDNGDKYINYGDAVGEIEQLPTVEVGTDAISRQKAINALYEWEFDNKDERDAIDVINGLPPIQPEIIRCKDCQYWNKGSCECREHAVNCQDYYVGDIETEAEYFCGYADRREVRE